MAPGLEVSPPSTQPLLAVPPSLEKVVSAPRNQSNNQNTVRTGTSGAGHFPSPKDLYRSVHQPGNLIMFGSTGAKRISQF